MNQSENKTANQLLESLSLTHCGIDWNDNLMKSDSMTHETIIEAIHTYANLRTISLIQTIENRIAELEELSDIYDQWNVHDRIEELKNILQTIKKITS